MSFGAATSHQTERSRELASVLPWIRKAITSTRLHPSLEDEAIQQTLIGLVPYVDKLVSMSAKERASYVWIASVRTAARVRRKWRAAQGAELPEHAKETYQLTPELALDAKERAGRALSAFEELPPADQQTATMVLAEGLPEAIAAARLDAPRGTVASRVRRAREALRRAWLGTTSWVGRDARRNS